MMSRGIKGEGAMLTPEKASPAGPVINQIATRLPSSAGVYHEPSMKTATGANAEEECIRRCTRAHTTLYAQASNSPIIVRKTYMCVAFFAPACANLKRASAP